MPPSPRPRLSRTVFFVALGGVIAAALDIGYAFAFFGHRGVPAARILQSIASGLLGARSYQGGASTAALGLLLHVFIAVVASGVFYAFSVTSSLVRKHWAIFGILFGLGMYAFMNLVVIPLSAVPYKPAYPWAVLLSGLFVHAFFVGLPIAACVRAGLQAAARPPA